MAGLDPGRCNVGELSMLKVPSPLEKDGWGTCKRPQRYVVCTFSCGSDTSIQRQITARSKVDHRYLATSVGSKAGYLSTILSRFHFNGLIAIQRHPSQTSFPSQRPCSIDLLVTRRPDSECKNGRLAYEDRKSTIDEVDHPPCPRQLTLY